MVDEGSSSSEKSIVDYARELRGAVSTQALRILLSRIAGAMVDADSALGKGNFTEVTPSTDLRFPPRDGETARALSSISFLGGQFLETDTQDLDPVVAEELSKLMIKIGKVLRRYYELLSADGSWKSFTANDEPLGEGDRFAQAAKMFQQRAATLIVGPPSSFDRSRLPLEMTNAGDHSPEAEEAELVAGRIDLDYRYLNATGIGGL